MFRKCLKGEAERVASHSGPEINHRVAYEHVLINCASVRVSSPAGGIRLRATRSCEGPEGGVKVTSTRPRQISPRLVSNLPVSAEIHVQQCV